MRLSNAIWSTNKGDVCFDADWSKFGTYAPKLMHPPSFGRRVHHLNIPPSTF